MHNPAFDRLCRSASLSLFSFTLGVLFPYSAHALEVADGMALIRQTMPANYCALTFDDGPGPYTAELLDLLASRGIVATFFVLGQQVERRPALIKRMLAEGHEVASHSWSHPNMRKLKFDAQRLELKKTSDLLLPLGVTAKYFRPPYGRYNANTVALTDEMGMTIMLWSLDSQDWKRHVSKLEGLRSISPSLQQSFSGMRGVLLFHDTHKHTVAEMPEILDALLAGGCERFVTVSEYLAGATAEEERRLSTHAPNEGVGENPPVPLPENGRDLPLPPAAVEAAAPAQKTLPPLPLARSDGRPVPRALNSGATPLPGSIPPLLSSQPDLITPTRKPPGGLGVRRAGNGPG